MRRFAWFLSVCLALVALAPVHAQKPRTPVRVTPAAQQLPDASPSAGRPAAPAPAASASTAPAEPAAPVEAAPSAALPAASAAPASPAASPVQPRSDSPPTVPPAAEPTLRPAKATPVTVAEEPDTVPAHAAGAADRGFSPFSLGGLILLAMLIGCGAGVVILHAKLKDLDERLSGLKMLLARMKDSLGELEQRGQGLALPPPAARTPAAPAAGEVDALVARAVERALGDARAQAERAEARAAQLERDLAHVTGPAVDDLRRRVEAAERRNADGGRNPFSSHGRAEPANGGDPMTALAAGLARAHARLASRAASPAGPADAVAVRMAESLEPVAQALTSVEGAARAGSGPLEREVAELAARLADFSRGVRQRAGQPVEPAAAPAPLSLEQFVSTYGDQLSADARTRPVILLSTYLEHVSRATGRPGAAPGPTAGAAQSEPEMLQQIFTYVDVIHDLRTRAAAWDRTSSGSEQLSGTLDRLFDAFRNLLRAYSISVVAPEEGQPADASAVRVTSSVARRDAQPHTVVKVVRCGFKNTLSGELIRMAEVITAS